MKQLLTVVFLLACQLVSAQTVEQLKKEIAQLKADKIMTAKRFSVHSALSMGRSRHLNALKREREVTVDMAEEELAKKLKKKDRFFRRTASRVTTDPELDKLAEHITKIVHKLYPKMELLVRKYANDNVRDKHMGYKRLWIHGINAHHLFRIYKEQGQGDKRKWEDLPQLIVGPDMRELDIYIQLHNDPKAEPLAKVYKPRRQYEMYWNHYGILNQAFQFRMNAGKAVNAFHSDWIAYNIACAVHAIRWKQSLAALTDSTMPSLTQ